MFKQLWFNKRIGASVILILLCVKTSLSQESINAAYNYGSILIHSTSINEIGTGPVKGFIINYSFSNKRGEEWRKYYNYPNYGISYNFKSYGNPDVLGNSHSLTSFLQLSFLRKHRFFDLGFKGFAGAGYFTKIYDPVKNPKNRAISAHINISAEARLYSKIRVEPLFIEYSFGLNHFSNGLTKAPNLGINVLNNTFTFGYEFEKQAVVKKPIKTERPALLKNEFWFFASTGLKEVDGQEQKYMFSSISLNFSKQFTPINKIGVGLDFFNDPSLTSQAYTNYHYLGESDLNFRYGFNIHNEFLMGKTSLFAAYGFYLRKSEFYTSRGYYKAGFKFYFGNILGVVLIRAIPLFRADVVEFGIGYRFLNKKKIK